MRKVQGNGYMPKQDWETEDEKPCKVCGTVYPIEQFYMQHLHRGDQKAVRDSTCTTCRSKQKLENYAEWKKTKHRFQTWLPKEMYAALKAIIQFRGETQQAFLQRAVKREIERCIHEVRIAKERTVHEKRAMNAVAAMHHRERESV